MRSTKDPLMETYRGRLALYVSHKPYRETTNHEHQVGGFRGWHAPQTVSSAQ